MEKEEIVLRCPILPNWSMKLDGSCKRWHMCSDERHDICGALPEEQKIVRPYSKSKTCPCKYTTMVPTDETVMIKGQEKRIYLVACKECGRTRRTVI